MNLNPPASQDNRVQENRNSAVEPAPAKKASNATFSAADAHTSYSPFHSHFEQVCADSPHAAAILSEHGTLDYAGLNRQANRIAHTLIARGVAAESCIGVCLDRSPDAVAAMLGILKSGAAFVPLDPDYPSERLHYMLQDAAISLLITQPDYQSRFDGLDVQSLLIDSDFPDNTKDSNPDLEIAPSQLAYIMYTSGSTGNPKGVQIEHASLTCYCQADIEAYRVVPEDCTLQFSTLNFDISIEEIFPPLMIGSRIAIRPQTRSASSNELSELIRHFGVTAVHIATAYWHEWIDLLKATDDRVPESIRLMVVTGEKVSVSHYHKWLELIDHEALWANAYGPTEATVSATVFVPPPGWTGEAMPIGKALKNYTTRILDEKLQPVAEGETGELFIGGPALSRGYLNRQDLTDKAFVQRSSGELYERLYKTGDLARYLPNGDIDFAGRIDHQIKVGSYRIEPGEIEENINAHPAVLESLVIGDESRGQKRIVAYVAHGDNELERQDLLDFLEKRLPVYMLPASCMFLSRFPKTINGKVDRRALPAPEYSQTVDFSGKTPPRTDTEKQVAGMWAELIGHNRIGIEDNFFAAGGQSILALRFITQVRERFSVDLPVMAVVSADLRQVALQINPEDRAEEASTGIADRFEPLFFGKSESPLYGVLHLPRIDADKLPVVICQPTGHEYMRTHRSLRILATELARRGHYVLRFDYFGCGDSDGSLTEADLSRWQDDVHQAVTFTREKTGSEKVHLLGVRLGAALAVAARPDSVDQLILWDPVHHGAEYLNLLTSLNRFALTDLDRFRWMQNDDNSSEILGYEYKPELLKELSRTDFTAISPDFSNTTRIVLSGQKTTADHLQSWLASGDSSDTALVRVENTQHWENPVYLNDILLAYPAINAILDELK